MTAPTEHRTVSDSMGSLTVPANVLWGAQTQRALENFPVSGIRFPRPFIRALGLIKSAAATVMMSRGMVDESIARAIIQAAGEVAAGDLDDHFPLDIFQTGRGPPPI